MPDATEVEAVIPSYKETIQEISRQLSLRKGTMTKRVIFMIWPPMLAVISLVLVNYAYKAGLLREDWQYINILLVAIAAWIIFSIFYYYILSFIFDIEKKIWVDSFFDKKNLDPKDSWKIAKKLFWPYLRLQFEAFLRYLLPAIVAFFLFAVYILIPLTHQRWFIESSVSFAIVMLPTFIIAIYFYYLRVILRYLPFVFLDRYGTDQFSYSGLFKEMRKLKKIESAKTHTRTLLANLSSDIFTGFSSVAGAGVQAGLGRFGVVGEILGVSARMTGEEAAKQISAIGKIVTVYLLYQFARQQLYNEPQHINERLYNILQY